jgi:hypothetical protein
MKGSRSGVLSRPSVAKTVSSEPSADRPTKPRPGNSLRDRWCGAKRRHFPAERKALSSARGSARPFARRLTRCWLADHEHLDDRFQIAGTGKESHDSRESVAPRQNSRAPRSGHSTHKRRPPSRSVRGLDQPTADGDAASLIFDCWCLTSFDRGSSPAQSFLARWREGGQKL